MLCIPCLSFLGWFGRKDTISNSLLQRKSISLKEMKPTGHVSQLVTESNLKPDFFMDSTLFFFFFFSLHFPFLSPHGLLGCVARGQVLAAVVTFAGSSCGRDPLTNCSGLGIEPASWCFRDTTDRLVPQWELLESPLLHLHFFFFFFWGGWKQSFVGLNC